MWDSLKMVILRQYITSEPSSDLNFELREKLHTFLKSWGQGEQKSIKRNFSQCNNKKVDFFTLLLYPMWDNKEKITHVYYITLIASPGRNTGPISTKFWDLTPNVCEIMWFEGNFLEININHAQNFFARLFVLKNPEVYGPGNGINLKT